MNSHYFANRLDKKPNTFTTSSLDKLCDILNAKHNKFKYKISLHESYYDIDIKTLLIPNYDLLDKNNEYLIDYNMYSHGVRNALKAISGL